MRRQLQRERERERERVRGEERERGRGERGLTCVRGASLISEVGVV